MSKMSIIVEVTGSFRSGTAAKSGKPYFMCDAFAHLPGIPYPQQFSFYAAAQVEIPQAGAYECDIKASVKDGRINFEVDPRDGRRVNLEARQPTSVQKAG